MAGRMSASTGSLRCRRRAIAVALQFGHGMLRLEARLVVGAGPFILGLLHIEHGRRKHLDVPMWSGWCAEIAIALMSAGFTPSWSSAARPASWAGARAPPWDRPAQGHSASLRPHREYRCPEPALRVLDQIAAIDKIHRLAFVDTGDQREMSPAVPSPQFRM